MLIDTHAHLDMDAFEEDLDRVVFRAREAGVVRIVTMGSDIASSRKAVGIAHGFAEVFAAAGIHPHEAGGAGEEDWRELERLLEDPRVVALGEIGLDYFYDHAPREIQEEAFRVQLRLARSLGKPVVIHVRDAHEDARRILRETGVPPNGGVVHCFTGTLQDADAYLEMGLFVSFTGILTFPKGEAVRQAAARVPLHRLLVETDAPYLAPVPYRGKRNEPAYVVEVARKLAEIKGVSLEELAEVTTRNASLLFGIPLEGDSSGMSRPALTPADAS